MWEKNKTQNLKGKKFDNEGLGEKAKAPFVTLTSGWKEEIPEVRGQMRQKFQLRRSYPILLFQSKCRRILNAMFPVEQKPR